MGSMWYSRFIADRVIASLPWNSAATSAQPLPRKPARSIELSPRSAFDRDNLFGHFPPPSSHGETQLNLLALRRLHNLATTEHVAFGLRDRHGLPLLVGLRQAAEPSVVVSDPAVVLADDGSVDAGRVAGEADVVRRRVQLLSTDDDVRAFGALVTLVADQRSAVGVSLGFVAEVAESGDEMALVATTPFAGGTVSNVYTPGWDALKNRPDAWRLSDSI